MERAYPLGNAIPVIMGAAFALSACHPPHPHPALPPRVISTLDCPGTQGDLTRKSAAADGKSCAYADDNGDQVTLQLVSLDGKDLRTAMAPIEAQLHGEVPAAASPPATPANTAGPPPPATKDKVDIDLPGVHIHAGGNGHADVDAQGVHVHAQNGDGHNHDNAEVRVGGDGAGVNINANDAGAQVRIDERGPGLRARYILASDTPGPHGYRSAWYDARGPVGGPIAVAVVLKKSGDEDDLRHDARKLLWRNVGD